MLDIKEDIREECAKLGEVTNVVLFDKEPDGVASVRFSTPEAANACIRVCISSYSQSIAFHILHCSATFPTTTPDPSQSPVYPTTPIFPCRISPILISI